MAIDTMMKKMIKRLLLPTRTATLCIVLVCVWFQACSTANNQLLKTISPEMASNLISKHKNNSDFIILDIRTPREFNDGHIEEAILLDFYSKTYTDELKILDKSKIYLIYCRSGNRSGKTLELIKYMGFRQVYNMDRGIRGWLSKGFPVVK
jgi:rhodanese-related sulfurtransferase